MIREVVITKAAEKDLRKLPVHIVRKLMKWVEAVEESGLEEVRKIKSYHDEPLKGIRQGERSLRLSISYRAVYRIIHNHIEFAEVREVSKHEY